MAATIVGQEQVERVLELAGPQLRQALNAALEVQGVKLAQYAKFHKLSGQVLHVRTGTLRRSVHSTANDSDPNHFYVDVGTNVPYGAVHEFGFQGLVSVREHLRRAKSGKESIVRAHTMHMNLRARPWLRPSLQESKDNIVVALKAAMMKALQTLASGAQI